MSRVGFIGLGTMGLGMANNIIAKGHTVIGYDPQRDAMEKHIANGGIAATSPAGAAKDVDVVITMLPNGDVVKEALFGADGATNTLSANAIVIDMSTIHPFHTDEIRVDLAHRGLRMVDAPVGRTSAQAKTGNALFMIGAENTDLEEVRPVLECMGDTIIDCGGPGKGSRMKIVNNLMTTTLNTLTAEVLTFSEAVGMERDVAIDVMRGTPAVQSHMTTTYQAKVFKDDLSPAFMIDLAKKDLDIALDLSEKLKIPLSLAAEAEEIYASAQKKGRGAQDWTAIYAMLQEQYL